MFLIYILLCLMVLATDLGTTYCLRNRVWQLVSYPIIVVIYINLHALMWCCRNNSSDLTWIRMHSYLIIKKTKYFFWNISVCRQRNTVKRHIYCIPFFFVGALAPHLLRIFVHSGIWYDFQNSAERNICATGYLHH